MPRTTCQRDRCALTDPALNVNNPNNPTQTAGTTFLGQFVDHDLTFDTTSRLGVRRLPGTSPNARTPAFDLDSVYGGGPVVARSCTTSDPAKLRIEIGGLFEDLPRARERPAIIADPRNDEHLMIAGLHAAFIGSTTARWTVRSQRRQPVSRGRVRRSARRLTTWHYQWIVLHEFLPQIIGQALATKSWPRPRFFRPNGAATSRSSSRAPPTASGIAWFARPTGEPGGGRRRQPFFGLIFDPAGEGRPTPSTCGAAPRAASVHWLADLLRFRRCRPPRSSRTSRSTRDLHTAVRPAARRDRRGEQRRPRCRSATCCASDVGPALGPGLAREMGVPLCAPSWRAERLQPRPRASTPLWYYVLKEAELLADGRASGPSAGASSARCSSGCCRSMTLLPVRNPMWKPTLPTSRLGYRRFRMIDFLDLRRRGSDQPGAYGQRLRLRRGRRPTGPAACTLN